MKAKKDELIELPKDLQEKFNETKELPSDEPELYKIIVSIQANEASKLEIAVHMLGEDSLDNYEEGVIETFCDNIIARVSSFMDEDGYYKNAPALKTWQPIKPSKAFKILKSEKANIKIKQKILKDVDFTDSKSMEKVSDKDWDKITKMGKDFEKQILEISGVEDIEKLSKWEKDLLLNMTSDSIRRFDNSSLGKLFRDS